MNSQIYHEDVFVDERGKLMRLTYFAPVGIFTHEITGIDAFCDYLIVFKHLPKY